MATANQLPGDGILAQASKPYPSAPADDPFPLTPLLQLPPAFGAAYVGTTFACTLCANNDISPSSSATTIRNVEVAAELQAPSGTIALSLSGQDAPTALPPGATLQRVVRHDLKEDGQHVLAVTVTYHEYGHGKEEQGTKRTFRKLYQFIAQPAIGVRTKFGELKNRQPSALRKFVLEAQLENLTETTVVLDSVNLNLAPGLTNKSLNWDASSASNPREKEGNPVLAPQDVMQVAFVLQQIEGKELEVKGPRILMSQMHIDWRGPMGEKGELTTGWLACRGR